MVRHNGDLSESINIKQGVIQGYVVSPDLFALYTEMIMRGIEGKGCVRIGGNVINKLRYADDTVIIAETERAATTYGRRGTIKQYKRLVFELSFIMLFSN